MIEAQDTMLINLLKYICMPAKENIIKEVIIRVWENPCPAYTILRKKSGLKLKKSKWRISVPLDTDSLPIYTTK